MRVALDSVAQIKLNLIFRIICNNVTVALHNVAKIQKLNLISMLGCSSFFEGDSGQCCPNQVESDL